ncbi:MAG: PAS domain-containing protein [Candidatus Baltobacteraceae bacterium]
MPSTHDQFSAWRTAADALPTMVFTARPDGGVEWLNSRWRQFTGLDPSVALDDAWQSIVHPDDLPDLIERWTHSIASGEDFHAEARVRRDDNTYFWVLSSASAQRGADGSITRWYGTALNVDYHKQIEYQLKDSERKFRALADAIPVICWTADEKGWIDWYNQRWYGFTGQTLEEAQGWGWQAAHHPDDFPEVMKAWPHSIATGEPFEMEFRLRGNDGLFHWFFTRVEPLRDETGRVVRWYGSNVDVNAQKEALERTKRVAQTLQEVFLLKELPRPRGIRLDAVYLPAERDALVGGDWFDAFELPDGRFVFSIGDVAGHGLDASIIVGRLRQAIFTLAFQFNDPARILKELDGLLSHQEPDLLVTGLVGFIDTSRAELRYATAGHPPPMIAYPGEKMARVLEGGDPPLGMRYEPALRTFIAPISQDAVLAVYTDGITEFDRDVIAAEKKLQTALALMVGNRTIARPATAVQELVFDQKPTRDDAALLFMQFSDVDATVPTLRPALEKSWRFHSSDAHSARKARMEIAAYLRHHVRHDDELFESELIIGEILANTVEHAPGLVEVELDWLKERPEICVRDTGPGLTRLTANLPENPLDEDGRGIYLIKTLAHDASVRQIAGYGTELRVTLPLKRAQAGEES